MSWKFITVKNIWFTWSQNNQPNPKSVFFRKEKKKYIDHLCSFKQEINISSTPTEVYYYNIIIPFGNILFPMQTTEWLHTSLQNIMIPVRVLYFCFANSQLIFVCEAWIILEYKNRKSFAVHCDLLKSLWAPEKQLISLKKSLHQ